MERSARRHVLTLSCGAVALIVLLYLSTARRAPFVHRPIQNPNASAPRPPITAQRIGSPPPAPMDSHPPKGISAHVGSVLGTMILVVVGAAVLALVVVVAVSLVRWLLSRPWRRVSAPVAAEPPHRVDRIIDVVAAERNSIEVGTPTNAIIDCWIALERAASDVGIRPKTSETPAELTIRLLDGLTVDPAAVQQLAALYREARFSLHPLTEQHRQQAVAALDRLHADLAAEAGT